MPGEAYDWISIGSGAAGLGGAVAAAAFGGRCLVLEKTEHLGGGTAYSYGALWAGGNHLQSAAGIEDSSDAAERYLRWLAGGFGDEERLVRLARASGPVLRFFAERGLQLRIIRTLPDHYYPTAPGSLPEGRDLEVEPIRRDAVGVPPEWIGEAPYLHPGVAWSDAIAWGGFGRQFAWDPRALAERAAFFAAGQGLVARLVRAATDLGVAFQRGVQVRRLLQEDGRVVGVEVDGAAGPVALQARRGVLLATGGYDGNPALVRAFEAFPSSPNHYPPSVAGDGMVLGCEIGAAVSVMPMKLQVMLGYRVPLEVEPTGFRSAGIAEMAAPHSLVVNRQGERFGDESFFQDFMTRLREFDVYQHGYANLPCYLVFDAQFARQQSFCGRPPGASIPEWVERGASVEELSGKLGVDATGLERTLAAFNAGAREGEDPLFHRGELAWARSSLGDSLQRRNPNLGTVAEPPFYGIQLHPSGTSAAGLVADADARIRHVRGHPIPGLYGAGNVCTCTEYGAGFQAGLTLMSGVLFGYAAARHAFGATPVWEAAAAAGSAAG